MTIFHKLNQLDEKTYDFIKDDTDNIHGGIICVSVIRTRTHAELSMIDTVGFCLQSNHEVCMLVCDPIQAHSTDVA